MVTPPEATSKPVSSSSQCADVTKRRNYFLSPSFQKLLDVVTRASRGRGKERGTFLSVFRGNPGKEPSREIALYCNFHKTPAMWVCVCVYVCYGDKNKEKRKEILRAIEAVRSQNNWNNRYRGRDTGGKIPATPMVVVALILPYLSFVLIPCTYPPPPRKRRQSKVHFHLTHCTCKTPRARCFEAALRASIDADH